MFSRTLQRTGSLADLQQYRERDLQQLKNAVYASELRFQNVITKIADGIAILDSNGRVCFVNPSAESLFSYKAEELIGQDFFGNLVKEAPACEMDTEVIQRMGESGTSSMRVVQTLVQVTRKGGEKAIAEMRVMETEWEGKMAFVASLRDVTEKKRALDALRKSEAEKTELIQSLREKAAELEKTLQELKHTQSQLIQTEKMSGLGQLVAGVAHEINNPINFIYGNLDYAVQYVTELMQLLHLYQTHYPEPPAEIQTKTEEMDLHFLMNDLPKTMSSMQVGTDRIREIVLSLRNFSRLDEAEKKPVNIHEGIDSTLLILQNRFKSKAGHPAIEIIKEYGNLPKVDCYAGQLNQVFMNLLSNALDALESQHKPGEIKIHTEVTQTLDGRVGLTCPQAMNPCTALTTPMVTIRITDNGPGMSERVRQRVFEPFFTTKPVGKGTGLGLSISYQIVVEKHGGHLECISSPGEGTQFIIQIPIRQGHAT